MMNEFGLMDRLMKEMEAEAKQLPFGDLLDALLGTSPVNIPDLFRLSDMQTHEIDVFTVRWQEVEDERRREITQHLADLSEENFAVDFAPVFKLCLDDSFDLVRKAALDGLWDTTNTRLVSPIIELMQNDKSVAVRKTAADTLAHFVLMGEWGQIPKSVQEQVVDALLEVYRDDGTSFAVKRAALEAMGSSSHPDVPELISEAYNTPNWPLQASALFAMGVSADKKWVGTLLDEMESPYEELRAEAARAAGEIGDSSTLDRLAELVYDDDIDVQKAAVYAIAKIGGKQAEQILSNLLDDEDAVELHESIEEAMEMDILGEEIDLDEL